MEGHTDPMWTDAEPLILASRSQARTALLRAAGIAHELEPADVDERSIAAPLIEADAVAGEVALRLARAKATAISMHRPGRLVLGADQVLTVAGRMLAKPADRTEAERHLRLMRGRDHTLTSALSLVVDGRSVFETVEAATLWMRDFSEEFLAVYLDSVGKEVFSSVGCYRIEDVGIQLFERIEGDHAVIMGLPVLSLLGYLRERGALLS